MTQGTQSKKNDKAAPKTHGTILYSRIGVHYEGVGHVGPNTSAIFPDEVAERLLANSPGDWSLNPYSEVQHHGK